MLSCNIANYVIKRQSERFVKHTGLEIRFPSSKIRKDFKLFNSFFHQMDCRVC